MTIRLLVATLLMLAAATGAARAEDADLVFWNAIRDSRNPQEYQAYLKVFPKGKFAGLALLRAGGARPAAPAATVTATAAAQAVLVVLRPVVAAVERIGVDVDARPLRNGTNHRLIVVPAGTPDAIDPETLAALGTSIAAERIRTTLPPAEAAGENEVRLYTIPRFGRSFEIAARAPVEVTPGAPGAIIVAHLTREARAIGAVAFEAGHRDRPMRVDGQFLRVSSGTTDGDLLALLRGADPTRFVVVSLGHLGTPADDAAGPSEVACVLATEDDVVLDRVAAMQPGDEVVAEGVGSTWGASRGSEFVVFNPCRLSP